jgi:hypothetical protein
MSVWALVFGLIGTVISILTFITMGMRGVLSVEKRLTKLETRMEPFTEGLKALAVDALRGIKPGGNPINPERYQYLLNQMNQNSLTQPEAQEFNTALLELQEEARRSNDLAKLLAIGLGLIILAAILSNR